ncbi:MAG: hypothetical protein ACXAE3_12020 [Candidatus Kariarchaeaceae archaeon]|jgi:hypothetical protein
MSENYSRNLFKSLPLTFLAVILGFVLSYLNLPTNVGYTFWALVFTLSVSYYVFMSSEAGTRSTVALVAGGVAILLLLSLFLAPMVFTRIDNAKYFDEQLTYMGPDELPFTTRINGSELRVVDKDLARSIMDKSNPFGSNKAIYSIHLGNYQGQIYWIGAAIFDGLILNDANNRVVGFIMVDITDPTISPVILNSEFELDPNLIYNHDLHREVWFEDINYIISDNPYFSYNDEEERMEYVVPYSIRDSAFLGEPKGGFVTSDMQLDGGVMIFGPEGSLIRDYSAEEREELPKHAQIQAYSEAWLENQIRWWGRSLVDDNDVRWSTVLPWIRSERKLGVDDDVRVVINPDNFKTVQYILLDSTDSTNQILRGAIKANISGLYYYNFEEYSFIDTNSAHTFVEETITNIRQTSTHGYEALLPILYPVKENVTSLRDYAYVMPLQLGQSRFGGIAVINPADKTGTQSVVEFVESEENANIAETVSIAIDRYLNLIEGIPVSSTNGTTGEFTIGDIRSYEENGFTNYVMEGNMTDIVDQIRVIFRQDLIANDSLWLEVVFVNVGDVLDITVDLIDGVYYAIAIYL